MDCLTQISSRLSLSFIGTCPRCWKRKADGPSALRLKHLWNTPISSRVRWVTASRTGSLIMSLLLLHGWDMAWASTRQGSKISSFRCQLLTIFCYPMDGLYRSFVATAQAQKQDLRSTLAGRHPLRTVPRILIWRVRTMDVGSAGSPTRSMDAAIHAM